LARLRPGGDLGVWSGANLLLGGCSMGATRYPVVAARYAESTPAGSAPASNGVCMSDGVVDVRAQDAFVGAAPDRAAPAATAGSPSAYTRAAPTAAHACGGSEGGQCACDPDHAWLPYPGDCGDGDCVEFDSIVTRGPDGPGLRGRGRRRQLRRPALEAGHRGRCAGTTTWPTAASATWCRPGPSPICARCSTPAPDHDCAIEHVPDAPHCASYNANLGPLCLDWFATLP
jgi:hypothetical protein